MPDESISITLNSAQTENRGGAREGLSIFPAEVEVFYTQRVYDSTAGWCWYRITTLTDSPLSSQTTPNHTDNLVAGTYERLV
jgi:hypothetical protein